MLRVGAATRDITPPPALLAGGALFLAGYASDARTFTASGVWKPIYVRALAVEDAGGQRAVMASLDLTSVEQTLTDAVIARLTGAGCSRANTVMSVTHTHSAPVSRRWPTWPAELQNPNAMYMSFLEDQCVNAIADAVASLEPATLQFARGQCDIAVNRRPAGEWYDRDLDVVHARDTNGNTIAVMFKYGCHPVASGVNENVSPDFPGMARDVVESELGGIALFFQGFGGTVTPRQLGQEEVADEVGSELGEEVIALAQSGDAQPIDGTLSVLRSSIDLTIGPYPDDATLNAARNSAFPQEQLWGALVTAQLAAGTAPDVVGTDIHSIRIGDATDGWHVATVAHEVVTEYVLELQQLWATNRLTLLGYADEVDCYLGTQEIVARLPGAANQIPSNPDYEGCYSALWYGLAAGFTANAPEDFLDHVATVAPDTNGITGTPAVLATGNEICSFARGVAGDVVSVTRDGAAWGALVTHGSAIMGSPQLVDSDFGPVVVARGVDGDVLLAVREPAGWSDWISLGGATTGVPSVAWTGDHLVVMVRGIDGGAWVTWSDGPHGPWSAWADFPGATITNNPSLVHVPTGGLFALARTAGPTGNVFITRALGPQLWTAWDNLQGGITGAPVAYASDDGEIAVFARGVDARVYMRYAPSLGGAFQPWKRLSGPATGLPSVTAMPGGGFAGAVRGDEGIVWVSSAPALDGPWRPFEDIGRAVASGPTLFADGPTLAFVARDTRGRLVYASQEQPASAEDSWMPPEEWIGLG